MSGVFEWVRGIVFYLILLTVVSHLVPGKKYEKYIRIFTGMLLVLIVIQPVRAFLGKDVDDDRIFTIDSIFQEEMSMDEGFVRRLEEIPAENMEEELSAQMRTFSEQLAAGYGYGIRSFEVQFQWEEEKVVPVKIDMTVSENADEQTSMSRKVDICKITVPDIITGQEEESQGSMAEGLRDAIADYYGMDGIQVEIRGE